MGRNILKIFTRLHVAMIQIQFLQSCLHHVKGLVRNIMKQIRLMAVLHLCCKCGTIGDHSWMEINPVTIRLKYIRGSFVLAYNVSSPPLWPIEILTNWTWAIVSMLQFTVNFLWTCFANIDSLKKSKVKLRLDGLMHNSLF